MKFFLAITALALTCLASHDQPPNQLQPRGGHTVQILRHTTLIKVLRRAAPYANTSSIPLPTWNASAAFTFFPSNSSTANSSAPAATQAQNSTAPKSSGSGGGLIGGLLSDVLGPITSGVLGPITSGLLNNSGVATGLSGATSAASLSMPTMSSLSMSLLSSVRWPNSTSGAAAPTGQGNGTKTTG
ncbi:hypothetical protein B0T18DRAFT_389984 [Schizothecium vesticola]|uniref:Uncharacterized protein n=1 Tax=Schizothecium vesticola TaxID=314040 RepID=A0AA40F3V2_9PEZI|nr:hypothetical protein B0T18DRAFT_389984 [Schizothecium vesticola]